MSVIVPLRPGAPAAHVVERLWSCSGPFDTVEVILAWGDCPSRQRNEAVRRAGGKLLLFLDDDSHPSSDLIARYVEAFRREPDLAAIGGPAVYGGGSFRERLAAAVLSEPLVTGRSAARYRMRGLPRATDERELILCNLAVRRRAFESAGGFDEALYPNEENLLLDRLRERGAKIRYQPSAVVTRPAPRAAFELLGKVLRYGRGRAAQARRRLCAPSAVRVFGTLAALVTLLAASAALPWTPWPLFALGSFLLLYQLALVLRISIRDGFRLGIAAPALATGVHLAYGAGVLWGLLGALQTGGSEVNVQKWNLAGGKSSVSTCPERRTIHVHEEDVHS